MNFLRQNWFKIIVTFCAVVFTFSVFYYFVIIPKQKTMGKCEKSVLVFWKKNIEGCNRFSD